MKRFVTMITGLLAVAALAAYANAPGHAFVLDDQNAIEVDDTRCGRSHEAHQRVGKTRQRCQVDLAL